MNIDKLLCNLKTCRYCHDYNCFSADYERCEYTLAKNVRLHGEWNDHSDEGYVECPFCDHATTCDDNIDELHYCFFCGASMSANDRQVTGKLKQPCPCETCQTAIDRCGCQMHLCSDYQKWKEGDKNESDLGH